MASMKKTPFLSRCKAYIGLWMLALKVKGHHCIDFCKTWLYYYGDPLFRKVDTRLLLSYWLDNPYRVCSRFFRSRGEEDPYTFGETPLTTLEEIAHRCQISNRDTVLELGCGRGRTCFWLARFVGCRAIGIDIVPTFIERAQRV